MDGRACTLRDVTIHGSISVTNGGSLKTVSSVTVAGSIRAFKSGAILLDGKLKVFGGVTVMDTNRTVVVGRNADIHVFSVASVLNVMVYGRMTSLSASNSGYIEVSGASILGGGIVRRAGFADLKVCASTITGGISFNEVRGDLLAVAGPGCLASDITGSIIVGKGSGDVRIVGNKLRRSDVIVGEQTGNVFLHNATVSDMMMQRVTGNINFDGLLSRSDGIVAMTEGNVTISRSRFRGDFMISRNMGVWLDKNSFGFDSVQVVQNRGVVHITNNRNLSINVMENDGVVFTANDVRVAEISKNRVKTVMRSNKFASLNCADNVPGPTGAANYVTVSATGQCALRP